ncbi:MAG: mechanosensitive ion channel family protein [Gammaproteobacteria bacterium]|nr:mechanosensitive ion channel family protein [Gammaproteobacteria bacterium]
MDELQQELDTLQRMIATASDLAVRYGFQVLAAIVILIVGFYLARGAGNGVLKLCTGRSLDPTLSRFFAGSMKMLVLVFVVIIAMSKFGITIAPFIAAIGALAFGSSFALSGPLSNFGAGITIILTRPFVIGNTIQVQGVHGLVKEITLSTTLLETEDGEIIMIPNKHIVGEILVNSYENRIIEGSLRISYRANSEQAMELIRDAINGDEQVVKKPPVQVGIGAFGEDALAIHYRYWVATEQFMQTQFRVNQAIYSTLQGAGIEIPTPRQQITITERS